MRGRTVGVWGALCVCLTACGGRAAHDSPAGSAGASSDAGAAARLCHFQGFAPFVSYVPANEPLGIVAVDRTHTGHVDLIVRERGDDSPSSELMANAGNGAFSLSASYAASDIEAANVVSADFNGDGHTDLASLASGRPRDTDVGSGTGLLVIDFGLSDGAFALQTASYPAPRTVGLLGAADFDGDGDVDIAIAGADWLESSGGGLPVPEPANYALDVFLNGGDGTFAAPTTYPSPKYFHDLAIGDFDGNGRPDIAELTSTGPGGFAVYFNAGDGTFRPQSAYVTTDDFLTEGLGVADFNRDGKDDLSTTATLGPNTPTQASVLQVYDGVSDGTLVGPTNYPTSAAPPVYQIVAGDFNGDTWPDLAMVLPRTSSRYGPTPIAVFPNLGDGTFGAAVTYEVGDADSTFATGIAAGDFNGDGVTDLAVTMTRDLTPGPFAVDVLLSRCK